MAASAGGLQSISWSTACQRSSKRASSLPAVASLAHQWMQRGDTPRRIHGRRFGYLRGSRRRTGHMHAHAFLTKYRLLLEAVPTSADAYSDPRVVLETYVHCISPISGLHYVVGHESWTQRWNPLDAGWSSPCRRAAKTAWRLRTTYNLTMSYLLERYWYVL